MAFDPKRIDRLAAKATLLEEQVHALVAELEELAELARTEAKPQPVAAPDPEPIVAHDPEPVAAPEPVADAEPQSDHMPKPVSAAESEPEPAPAAESETEPDPVSVAEAESESEAPAAETPAPESPAPAIPDRARVVALNMALRGTPRDETARYLRENYDVADTDALLDDVYAKAGS